MLIIRGKYSIEYCVREKNSVITKRGFFLEKREERRKKRIKRGKHREILSNPQKHWMEKYNQNPVNYLSLLKMDR